MHRFILRKLNALPESYRIVLTNSLRLFGLRALQKLLGLVTLYFVVRAIDLEMYGQYQFILSVVVIFCITTVPGLTDAATQSVARGFQGTYRLATRYGFIGSIFGALALFGMAAWYMWVEHDQHLAEGFLIAAGLFPFAKGLVQWGALKTGMEDFSSLVRWEGGAAIAMQVLIIVGVLLIPETFLVPLLFILAIPALQNLFLTWQAHKRISRDATIEKGSLSYGLRTTLYALPISLSVHIEKFLLFYLLSPATLALFAAAEKIPELTKSLIQDIGAVLGPRLAKQKSYTAKLDKVFKRFAAIAAVLIILVSFTILPWFFNLLFGDAYQEAVPYTVALMCSVALGNVAILRARFIRSQLDAVSLRDMNLVMAFSRIVGACILVPLYGLTGAVISVFVTRLITVVTVELIMRKRYALNKSS